MVTAVHISKTTDKKFFIQSWGKKKEGEFVRETIDEVIEFVKEAFQE